MRKETASQLNLQLTKIFSLLQKRNFAFIKKALDRKHRRKLQTFLTPIKKLLFGSYSAYSLI